MAKTKINKHPNWQMSGSERKWYYFGDTGRMFASQIITMYMAVFLLFQGMNAAAVATSILIVKMIDSVDDVIFGYFVDRLNPTKWKRFAKITGKGKYMPWYRLTFWTFPVATILFFMMPKSFSSAGKIVWFTVFYLLYDLTCTLSEVPMNSMVVTLTEDTEERNHILTVKGVITVVAAVLIAVVGQFLISEKVGVPITTFAIASSVVFLIMMIPMCFKVNEHNASLKNMEKEEEEEKYTLKDMMKCVFTNKYIFIYLLSTIAFSCLATQLAVQTFVGFYIFNDSNIFSYIMLVAFVPAIIISGFCGRIVGKLGKRNTLIGIFLISVACFMVQYFLRGQSIGVFVVIGAVCAIPNAMFSIVQNYIAPDTVDYTRYKTGKDCSGIFFALRSFITKATSGIASALALYILALAGWKEVKAESFAELASNGVQQSASALNALWNCGYLVPAIGCILAAVVMMFYKLKDKDADLMAKCNAGLITREECEAQLSRKY